MKICMAGLGSIGKRHLNNLVAVLKERGIRHQIDALRSGNSEIQAELRNFICRQYHHITEIPDDYDIVFITNPTSLHYDAVRGLAGKTKHMFIEKPVFDSLRYNLKGLLLRENSVYYVACPLRHKSILKYIKQKIAGMEKVISARIISTSYLPEWRKDTDYRTTYSAKKKMGGGVTLDLIHEWDYAVYLFGIPEKTFHMQGHVSGLEIDSDDVSLYIAQYPDMFLEIHLDYIGHKTERILQLFTDSKRLDVDLISNVVCQYQNGQLTEKINFPEEDYYKKEIGFFIDCIEGKQRNINTIADAYQTLEIVLKEEFTLL